MPDHAGHGGGIFLEVLDGEAVQARVELVVELGLGDAEKEHDAAGDAEPEPRPDPISKAPGQEQCQHQGQGDDARHDEVETQPHDEGLEQVRGGRAAGEVAVPEPQEQAQQLLQEQEQQEIAGEEGEIGNKGAGWKGPVCIHVVRGGRGWPSKPLY